MDRTWSGSRLEVDEGPSAVTIWLQLSALPAIFLFWMGFLYLTQRRTGVRLSLALFALLYAVGLWRVITADAAGARARVLLLPYEAVVAGLLGLGYAYGWGSVNAAAKIGGRLCLTAAVILIAIVAIGAG
jgi:hypothetical protein